MAFKICIKRKDYLISNVRKSSDLGRKIDLNLFHVQLLYHTDQSFKYKNKILKYSRNMYLYLGDEEGIYNMLLEAKTLKKNVNKFDNLKNKTVNTSVH